jgi:hypothetical protein
MKEAEYFGDIVIVPFMDNYDLVVLKIIAIVEYGVRNLNLWMNLSSCFISFNFICIKILMILQ